jgi:hypothetical protein
MASQGQNQDNVTLEQSKEFIHEHYSAGSVNYATHSEHEMQKDSESIKSMKLRTMAEHYEQSTNKYRTKLNSAWDDVQSHVKFLTDCPSDILALRKAEKEISRSFARYREISAEFAAFLIHTRSHDSPVLLQDLHFSNHAKDKSIAAVITELDERIQLALENMSRHSSSSKQTPSNRTNRSSTMSELLAGKRAKADGARTSVQYAQKEAGIRRQQALIHEQQQLSLAHANRAKVELDANLLLLQHEKDAAVAEAELRAIEDIMQPSGPDEISHRSFEINVPTDDVKDRTQRYVEQHTNQNMPTAPVHNTNYMEPKPFPHLTRTPMSQTQFSTDNINWVLSHVSSNPEHDVDPVQSHSNDKAPSSHARHEHDHRSSPSFVQDLNMDFSRFLLNG